MACILLWSSAARVQDSQVYRTNHVNSNRTPSLIHKHNGRQRRRRRKFLDRNVLSTTHAKTSLSVHRNLFWQLSWKLDSSGMSHAMTASPKPSFRAPRRVGDFVVGRGNTGWTTSKSGYPWTCQNNLQWPSSEKTG